MTVTKNEPNLILVYLLLVFMLDIYSGQKLDFVKDSCTRSDDIEILRKELGVLSQVVKDQIIKIDLMEGTLTSIKQKCCQCEGLVSSSESSPTTKVTMTTTKEGMMPTTMAPATHNVETTESPTLMDREFLILFMRNVLPVKGDLSLYITTKNETVLTISSSHDLSPTLKSKIDRKITVISNSNFTLPFDLTCEYLKVEPKAVLLQMTELSTVTAFDSFYAYSTDGSLIIPTDKLSTKYLVSATEPHSTAESLYSQFAIGALFDGTNISITFKMNKTSSLSLSDGSYTDGDVYSIVLERLETFQIGHTTDLTGTLISSSKPIAVFSGNRCQALKSTGCSHMVTQLPPATQFDIQYLVPTFYDNTATLIQVVSEHQSNINVTVGSNASTWNLSERDFINVEVTSNEITVIVSDQPVLVSGFGMGGPYHPYMTVIPGVHQYLDFYKITVPASYTENYMCVIIPRQSKNSLRINDLRINLYTVVYESVSVLNTTIYVVYTFEVEVGTFVLSTTDHSAFGLIVYGHRTYDGYSFAGNFLFP